MNQKIVLIILIIISYILLNYNLLNFCESLINQIMSPDDTCKTYVNNDKLFEIQNKLKIKYGTFNEELPEQLMAITYLTGTEKILEIGGNIGRNSLIIAYILNQKGNNNLVTLESDTDIANKLKENKELNKLDFHIENSALSINKMIQMKPNGNTLGGDTLLSDVVLDGYNSVNIISFNQLQAKYNIIFDTLVLDCEGAFYYILLDMPEIINNIKLILVENDYKDHNHKLYMDQILIKNNFNRIYVEGGGWGASADNFYEVWKK